MKLINTPTAVNHRFVDGNREVGRKATQFSAEWCNQVQQELWNLIVAIKGGNPDGSSEEEAAAAFNAYFKSGDVKMSPDEIDVAGAKFRKGSNGATLGTLYSLISGIIKATVKIAVGGSEWTAGNQQPSITGLYALEAGYIETTNMRAGDIQPKTPNRPIPVTGDLDVSGRLKMGKMDVDAIVLVVTDSTSAAAAETAMSNAADGSLFIVLNTSSSVQEVHFGAVAVNILAYRGLFGLRRSGVTYPLNNA